ncbi:MAG: histidine phosphatase family protein [Calditrichia bacterium]
MGKLILIKHSLPEINPLVPSKKWTLSSEGFTRCGWLAERLERYHLNQIFSSTEIKAIETAQAISSQLGLSNRSIAGLHENDRTNFPYFENPEEWKQQFRTFFQKPNEKCIGNESAVEATTRFSKALQELIAEVTEGDLVVVAHGTVITLFTAAHNKIVPFEFWTSLSLPSYVVLDLDTFELLEGPKNYPRTRE